MHQTIQLRIYYKPSSADKELKPYPHLMVYVALYKNFFFYEKVCLLGD